MCACVCASAHACACLASASSASRDSLHAQVITNWQCIGDATESALIKFIQAQEGVDVDAVRNRYAQLVTIPFNSANKFVDVVVVATAVVAVHVAVAVRG